MNFVVISCLNALQTTKAGTIIADIADRGDVIHMGLTTPVAYIHFKDNALNATDYIRIDSWVERLQVRKELGLKSV